VRLETANVYQYFLGDVPEKFEECYTKEENPISPQTTAELPSEPNPRAQHETSSSQFPDTSKFFENECSTITGLAWESNAKQNHILGAAMVEKAAVNLLRRAHGSLHGQVSLHSPLEYI
jgi:hypothetical protein